MRTMFIASGGVPSSTAAVAAATGKKSAAPPAPSVRPYDTGLLEPTRGSSKLHTGSIPKITTTMHARHL